MKKVIIIGAGASGVYLSSLLMKKCYGQLEVLVLEQNAAPLKKLLATGNGRCNLSNKDMDIQYFHSDDLNKVKSIIHSFDVQKAFEEIGLLSIYQGNLLYPRSEQALTVKNILMDEAINQGVRFIYNQEVIKIECQSQYVLYTQDHTYKADYVIFAMGSEAGKLSGMNQSRYDLFKQLKLETLPAKSSLVSLHTLPVLKQLKGVRVKGTFKLLNHNQCIHTEKGELLFSDYGVSGIAVMQLSSFIEDNQQYEMSLDLFDDYSYDELYDLIEKRKSQYYEHFYDGLVHNKISHYLETLNMKDTHKIVKQLKDFRLKITGLRPLEYAQVAKGGLVLKETDDNLQIKKYPHLYAIGENLNVTGLCGGYNLHFAFACAARVASAIEREINVKS